MPKMPDNLMTGSYTRITRPHHKRAAVLTEIDALIVDTNGCSVSVVQVVSTVTGGHDDDNTSSYSTENGCELRA